MIRVRSLFKFIIITFVMFMLGFFSMYESTIASRNKMHIQEVFVAAGIAMALYVIFSKKYTGRMSEECSFITRYMVIYLPSVLFIACYSFYTYQYSLTQILAVLIPYLYVFYAYPLVYIFEIEKNETHFLNTLLYVFLGMICIKTFCFIAYNYLGIAVFPGILFQYSGWVRDGVQRIDGGYLFGFFFTYLIYLFYSKKHNKVVYFSLIVFLFAFVVLVVRFRFQILVCICVGVVAFFVAGIVKGKTSRRIVLISLVIIAFCALGGVSAIIESFSTEGDYANSTLARLESFLHYYKIIKDDHLVFGVGLLQQSSPIVRLMVEVNSYRRYWLEDLGLIGGIFRFGILSIPVYFILFFKTILVNIKALNNLRYSPGNTRVIFLAGVSAFMMISCLALNIYDTQRALDVPFYLAVISYLGYNCTNNTEI